MKIDLQSEHEMEIAVGYPGCKCSVEDWVFNSENLGNTYMQVIVKIKEFKHFSFLIKKINFF